MLHEKWKLFFRQRLQRKNFLPVYMKETKSAEDDCENVGNREREPYHVESADLCKDESCRQKNNELAEYRYQQAQHTVSKRLEHGGADDGAARKQEADRDDPQGRDADGEHGIGGAENH